jgi:hypothetical protein
MFVTTKMKIIKNKFIFLYHFSLLLFASCNTLFSNNLNAIEIPLQDSTKKKPDITLLASYQQGRVLPTNDFVKGNNIQHLPINSFRAISLQLSRQTTGEELWEQLYNFPRYGVGIYTAQFIHTSELGRPVAIYGTFSIPLHRWKNISLNSDIGLGISFNWESFGEDNYNIALGSEVSGYVDGGLTLEYKLKNGILINVGTSFTHFSNGALKIPNLGINAFAPEIGLGINLTRSAKEFEYQVVPEYQKQSEFYISFFTGWENELDLSLDVDSITKNKGVYYPAFGLSAMFNRQISYKSKFGIGLMVDYLGAANTTITVKNGKLEGNNASFYEGLELSIFPSYELVINRISVILQPGFYLYRTKYPYPTPIFYQRIGLEYNILKDISLGINMHAHRFSIADYIEWTVGYRLHL